MEIPLPRTEIENFKIYYAIAGVLLVLGWMFIPRIRNVSAQRVRTILLGILAILTVANYYGFSTLKLRVKITNYDLMHYYLATRYFEELGYYDLYSAVLLIDNERGEYSTNPRIKKCRLQDARRGYRDVSVERCLERGRKIRAERFSADRWKAFERDFLYLQRGTGMSKRAWRTMVNDRGLNATPAWIVTWGPLARAVPVTAVKWICWLDPLLLIAALALVARVYGIVPMLWCLYFFGLTYSLRWPMPGLVFLRYGWVAALMVAMCALKARHHFAAGVLAAYAAVMRFFPFVWMWGPFAKGMTRLFDRNVPLRDRLDRGLLSLAAGFVTAVLLFEGVATYSLGIDAVLNHVYNIREHIKPEELSSRRVGFAVGYAYRGELLPKTITRQRMVEIKEQTPERLVVALALVLALGWALRKRPDDEAFGFGLIPMFLFSTASYYYFVARITLYMVHAADLSKLRNRVGLAMLIGMELFANWAETIYPVHRIYLVGRLSWLLGVYSVVMIGWLLWESRSERSKPIEDGA